MFDVELQRVNGEWDIVGDQTMLLLERRVHQTARWMGYRPLRLEATYWSGPLLCTPSPDRWLLGLSNIVGIYRNFQLVRDRIVDACIASLPEMSRQMMTQIWFRSIFRLCPSSSFAALIIH